MVRASGNRVNRNGTSCTREWRPVKRRDSLRIKLRASSQSVVPKLSNESCAEVGWKLRAARFRDPNENLTCPCPWAPLDQPEPLLEFVIVQACAFEFRRDFPYRIEIRQCSAHHSRIVFQHARESKGKSEVVESATWKLHADQLLRVHQQCFAHVDHVVLGERLLLAVFQPS